MIACDRCKCEKAVSKVAIGPASGTPTEIAVRLKGDHWDLCLECQEHVWRLLDTNMKGRPTEFAEAARRGFHS